MTTKPKTDDGPPAPDVVDEANDPYYIPDEVNGQPTRLKPRKVTLTPEEYAEIDPENNRYFEGVGTPKTTNVGRQFPNNPDFTPRTKTVFPDYLYIGNQLTGIANVIEREQYQTGDEAQPILAGMSPDDRMNMLRKLEIYGLYGQRSANSPSEVTGGGLGAQDIEAFRKLLIESNGRGRTWQGTLMDRTFEKGPVISGPRIRYTPKQDVRSTFRKVFLSDVGRGATEAEIVRFEQAYRGMESAAGTTQSAPSIGTAAEESIGMNNKAEEQANGFLQVAQTFERLMRG